MSALAVKVDARQLGLAEDVLSRLDPLDSAPLMGFLGRLMQQQSRRRIQFEKTSPDGAAWPANRTGTSILLRSGALMRSIDYASTDTTAIVGSGLIYARIQQEGGVITPKNAKRLVFQSGNGLVFATKVTLPARAFIGVSVANGREIIEATADWLMRKLGIGK